ncbi:trehalase [Bombina bombina]|uniref:trehalase n=1 Tax=Bombina bombina TaxID=8345 RepID=UPI00235AA65F|nr:trehalase [Bombina bombina]
MGWSGWCLAFSVIFCGFPWAVLNADLPPPCDSDIYCKGDLLHQVQLAKLFNDDKHFVDMDLRNSSEVVLREFTTLNTSEGGRVPKEKLKQFVETYFNPPGTEFEPWNPPDWHENPSILKNISDSNLRNFAVELHALWKSLGRKIKDEVRIHPDLHSQIFVPNAVIVPGGRFREFYYWDSYWVINGLLLSEMKDTARGMIENFLYMVERFGLIPNGGRVYYLRRSQPPFLTLMMDSYMEKYKNLTFLRNSIDILEKEYDFWMTNRSVTVNLQGKIHTLNRYHVPVDGPRPESYSDDYELAENLTSDSRQSLWTELKAAAESGWDFSSRWYNGSSTELKDTRTSLVIPVDLNAILCRVERTLAKFYQELGMPEKETRFRSALDARHQAIQTVLWDEDWGIWLDFNRDTQTRNPNFYPTNLAPLWAACYSNPGLVDKVVSYLENSKALSYKNGIPTSLTNSGQQWDFPNAWPPLQHIVIEGLAISGSTRAQDLAFSLAQNWVRSNYAAYREYKAMFEKYNVEGDGKPGGGGEYEVQLGFGWTNGVIFQLLDKYGSRLTSDCAHYPTISLPLLIISLFIIM